jgi:uncharacterized membrane protein
MKTRRLSRILVARVRLIVAALTGVTVGMFLAATTPLYLTILGGWDAAAFVFIVWMLATILPMDGSATANHASQEDPGRVGADVLLIVASIASLVAVVLVLAQAGNTIQPAKSILVGIGVLSVVLSWAIVHITFALRYARLFFSSPAAILVEFNTREIPRYSDFAYLALTIGMTFQVSDTNLRTSKFRAIALRHALLSYLFGTVIVATTINLLAGLSK